MLPRKVNFLKTDGEPGRQRSVKMPCEHYVQWRDSAEGGACSVGPEGTLLVIWNLLGGFATAEAAPLPEYMVCYGSEACQKLRSVSNW